MYGSIKRKRGLIENRQDIQKVFIRADDEIPPAGRLKGFLEILLILGLLPPIGFEFQPYEQTVDDRDDVRKSVRREPAPLYICEENVPAPQDIACVPLECSLVHILPPATRNP